MGDKNMDANGYKKLKEDKKKRHQGWRRRNYSILEGSDLDFRLSNENTAIIRTDDLQVDFYLTTGRWRDLIQKKTHRGGAQKFLKWAGRT